MDSWFNILENDENEKMTGLLRMTAAEWKDEGKRIIKLWDGDLRNCFAYLERVDGEREVAQRDLVPAPAPTEFDTDFALWRDMVENPARYGDDIVEWLELNDSLEASPGRWRLGAFWIEHAAKQAAHAALLDGLSRSEEEHAAATAIQAAVRGHIVRTRLVIRDCSMCLAHRISPLQTEVGRMCQSCADQGPHTETTGPLADPWNWFRCDWCRAPVESTGRFCDPECERDYIEEAWKE